MIIYHTTQSEMMAIK